MRRLYANGGAQPDLDSIVTCAPSTPHNSSVMPDLIWARGSAGCAILSEGDVTAVDMATIDERLGTLEVRVNNLETWAGPTWPRCGPSSRPGSKA